MLFALLISDDIHQMLNGVNKFLLSQSFLYVINLLFGQKIVITSIEIIKFFGVTDVSLRSLSKFWKGIELAMIP